jgi:hypothetical protein
LADDAVAPVGPATPFALLFGDSDGPGRSCRGVARIYPTPGDTAAP